MRSRPSFTSASGQPISRRNLLGLGAAVAGGMVAAPALAACTSGSSTGGEVGKDTKADLILSTWDIPADLVTYKKFAEEYKKTHPGVNIKVQKTPGGDFNQWFTTQLSGGGAPDIIRITWQEFGRYAQNGGLIDLSPYLPKNYGDAFQKTFWNASLNDGKPHAIPQHTDTFATYYRTDIFDKIGVKPPSSLDEAWKLDEFVELLHEVKAVTGKYGMVYGFGGVPTAYRWLPFLYMMGGQLLNDDLTKPAIDNEVGIKALEWFSDLYRKGLIPLSNTVKGSNDKATLGSFTTGQSGILLYGDWIMVQVAKGLSQDKWNITYMPRDTSAASDLGGNLLGVSHSSKHPEVAADFIKFVCNEKNMKYFCENDLFLPVRTSLTSEKLTFASQSEQMGTFVEQVETIPTQMARVETAPTFNAVNQVLADQLDLCFTGSKSPKDTAAAISEGIAHALS